MFSIEIEDSDSKAYFFIRLRVSTMLEFSRFFYLTLVKPYNLISSKPNEN